MNRRGAALIIALVLLAGLILLGLPFLFSQSAGLSGSRSFHRHQTAAAGQDTAEQLVIATVAQGQVNHLVQGGTVEYTRLGELITNGDRLEPNQWAVQPSVGVGNIANGALIGATVSDEQGKLDPNHLDAQAWTQLLAQVGINDWDDDRVWDSEDLNPNAVTDTQGDEHHRGSAGTPAAQIQADDDDGDDHGELAQALAELRFDRSRCTSGRLTDLDQLLQADPGHNLDDKVPAGDYKSAALATGSYGFRRPLTRAELGLLRPYLTLHLPRPGRDGWSDFGSVVINDGGTLVFDSDPGQCLAEGSVLARRSLTGFDRGHVTSVSADSATWRLANASSPTASDALFIDLPPTLNLHQASAPVLKIFEKLDGSSAITWTLGQQVDRLAELFSAPTVNHLSAARFLSPIVLGHALPPVDIASSGTITVASAASATDPLGRITADRQRTVIVQAVPQEDVLEARWTTQASLHALLAARHASQMTSWPSPIERRLSATIDVAGADPASLRPAAMPSWASGWLRRHDPQPAGRKPTHLDAYFVAAFGADAASANSPADDALLLADRIGGATPTQPTTTDLDTRLRPDGLDLTGQSLVWPLAIPGSGAKEGPVRATSAAQPELQAHHLSFWFSPTSDWASPTIRTLVEARTPVANLGMRIDGVVGSNELQNLYGVYYDGKAGLLVWVQAPPVIEHVVNSTVQTPFDDFTTFHLDERCLGNEPGYVGTLPLLGSLAPAQANPPRNGAVMAGPFDDANSLFGEKVSRLLRPNRVVQIMKVDDNYFRADTWHHLLLVCGGSQPYRSLMVLDQLAGEDVSRNPPAVLTDMKHGDRLALPTMCLDTALSMLPSPPTSLRVPLIKVKTVLGLTACDLFPARGMIRIGDEYILYEKATSFGFENCERGQRQNTNVNSGNATDLWPNTQQHLVGDPVLPGGMRLRTNGTLLRGGSTLAGNLGNGDPISDASATLYPWTIWARIDRNSSQVAPFAPDINGNARQVWTQAQTELTLAAPSANNGVANQFPDRGIIRFGSQVLAYRGKTGQTLLNIRDLSTFVAKPGAVFPGRADEVFFAAPQMDTSSAVILVGFPLSGTPLDDGLYRTDAGDKLVQLRHTLGRVEWISYDHLIADSQDESYLFHYAGFGPGNRGLQRTDFAGNLPSHLTATSFFPITTTDVLPVQNFGIDGFGHWLATGDVATLLPLASNTGASLHQVVIRYAATDGFAATAPATDPRNDTNDGWFALDHPMPDTLDLAGYELLVGCAWSGDDLTPLGPIPQPREQPLRLDLAPELAFGGRTVNAPDVDAGNQPTSADLVIDSLVAGPLANNLTDSSAIPWGIQGQINPTTNALATTDLATVGARILANTSAFSPSGYGLVMIGGEIFATRPLKTSEATPALPQGSTTAMIIGRGLLDNGTTTPVHSVGEGPLGHAQSLPVLPLPIGPVAQLNAAMPDHTTFTLDTGIAGNTEQHGTFDAPFALACRADGDPASTSVVALMGGYGRGNPSAVQYVTASWLRGLYRSTTVPPAATNLLIGWWPRFAPALPQVASAEHFRCRTFAWAGFPVGMHRAEFTEDATLTLDLSAAASDLFRVTARTSAVVIDWNSISDTSLNDGANAVSLGAAGLGFPGPATWYPGVELRVTWHDKRQPSTAIQDIASAGGVAPAISDVRVPFRAPITVLAVESAQ